MKKLAILCVLVLACVVFAAEPILRVGLITDTHIGKTAESCAHVRVAFEQLKPLKPDLIVHLGDIAHEHYPTNSVSKAAWKRPTNRSKRKSAPPTPSMPNWY